MHVDVRGVQGGKKYWAYLVRRREWRGREGKGGGKETGKRRERKRKQGRKESRKGGLEERG